MSFNEVKEHAPGRLHQIFADPYTAFDNHISERQLHLRVALQELIYAPLANGRLTLRVIYGWENGGFESADLAHCDHHIASLDALEQVRQHYRQALASDAPLPRDEPSLLIAPLAEAIATTEAKGEVPDAETRITPSRWPDLKDGLLLYTFFKVYHRLTYGEDDSYRSIQYQTPEGDREIHEFHIEEGDFAVGQPADDTPGESILLLHVSQLESVLKLLQASAA